MARHVSARRQLKSNPDLSAKRSFPSPAARAAVRPSKLQLERARFGVTVPRSQGRIGTAPKQLRCGQGEFAKCVTKFTPQGIPYASCSCQWVPGGSLALSEEYSRLDNPISMARPSPRGDLQECIAGAKAACDRPPPLGPKWKCLTTGITGCIHAYPPFGKGGASGGPSIGAAQGARVPGMPASQRRAARAAVRGGRAVNVMRAVAATGARVQARGPSGLAPLKKRKCVPQMYCKRWYKGGGGAWLCAETGSYCHWV